MEKPYVDPVYDSLWNVDLSAFRGPTWWFESWSVLRSKSLISAPLLSLACEASFRPKAWTNTYRQSNNWMIHWLLRVGYGKKLKTLNCSSALNCSPTQPIAALTCFARDDFPALRFFTGGNSTAIPAANSMYAKQHQTTPLKTLWEAGWSWQMNKTSFLNYPQVLSSSHFQKEKSPPRHETASSPGACGTCAWHAGVDS